MSVILLSKKDINLIRSAIRQSYHMSDHYRAFIKMHRIEVPKYRKDGTRAKKDFVCYKCEVCGNLYPLTQIDVDHIEPIGSFKTLKDAQKFISHVYCSHDKLQIICDSCHKQKTLIDNEFTRLVF